MWHCFRCGHLAVFNPIYKKKTISSFLNGINLSLSKTTLELFFSTVTTGNGHRFTYQSWFTSAATSRVRILHVDEALFQVQFGNDEVYGARHNRHCNWFTVSVEEVKNLAMKKNFFCQRFHPRGFYHAGCSCSCINESLQHFVTVTTSKAQADERSVVNSIGAIFIH